jgi:hypothetical protein
MFTLQQNWKKWQNRFCLEAGGAGERNGPNSVCTYVQMNKEKKRYVRQLGNIIQN